MGRLNFGLYGYRFKTDANWVTYKTIYGKGFRVLKNDIDSVTVAEGGRGKRTLQLMGHGSVLATAELPKPWVEKAQEFILRETGKLK